MKAQSRSNASRGFITIEIMIAFALMSVMFAGVTLADRGNTYWTLSTQASGATLPAAKADLDAASAASAQDFFHLTSAFTPDDPTCLQNSSCDGMRRTVTDISPCAKEVDARAERNIVGFPVQTSALSSYMTDPVETAALGGDCALSAPTGDWTKPTLRFSADFGSGNPTGIDILQGTAYVIADEAPYVRIVTAGGRITFANGFNGAGPYNAIDVARDTATGRTYAYVAAVSPQLQIIDVTDPHNPVLAGSAPLAGIMLTGTQAQAWRIAVYDRTAYVATRYMIAANPELHVFDVSAPTHPKEIGNGYKASTSIYGIVVHGQLVRGSRHRFAYLATTMPSAELKVLDVTDSARITVAASCDLPGDYQGNALTLLGTILYVGRDNVPNGGEDLYAFDASDPTSSAFCSPVAKTDIAIDAFSRHVEALRASGPYLFVATTNTTNAHGEMQIRNADPTTNLALLGTYAIPALAENAIDFEDNAIYAASTASPQVQVLSVP